MAGQSHRNLSEDEVTCELAHFSATGRSEENRRPLGEGKSFCGFSFAECYQSSRHKFSVKSPACGLQTHPHSCTNRLRFRPPPAESLILRSLAHFNMLVFLRCLPSIVASGYGAIRSASVS